MIQRNLMIFSDSIIPAIRWSQLFKFDDPQLFDDHLEVWTLIIQKFTVIPPSLISFLEKKVLPALVLASYIVYFAVACNFYFDNWCWLFMDTCLVILQTHNNLFNLAIENVYLALLNIYGLLVHRCRKMEKRAIWWYDVLMIIIPGMMMGRVAQMKC